MRYIADANGYLKGVSFGGEVICNSVECTEYTGGVPSGYASLVDWFVAEADKLYRWKIVAGELTLDSSATAPANNTALPIVRGGTEASTAVEALANLGALNLNMITDSEYMIASGANLNNYTTPGAYRCATAAIAGSLLNMTPYKNSGFRLIVSSTSTAKGVLQIVIFNSVRNHLYFRIRNDQSTWSEWALLNHSGNSMVELWNNGAPTSTFNEQDIAIAGANFNSYAILPHVSSNFDAVTLTQAVIVHKGENGHLFSLPNNKIARRTFQMNATGTSVHFMGAEYSNTYGAVATNNAYAIPMYIYGLY